MPDRINQGEDMRELNLSEKLNKNVQDFISGLKENFGQDLISVILYGSAASGEFVDKHSNLNFLVVLQNTDLATLKKATGLAEKFTHINPLFLTEKYIASSTDIFPIEFLDMQENYLLLSGKDVLKDIDIDLKNLRFQCEQELKAKLLSLRQLYISINKNKTELRLLLLKSFTSILHILRNVLRLKDKIPAYKKDLLLKELAAEFNINLTGWEKILAARLKKTKLSNQETEGLFKDFVEDLEKLVDIVDGM